MNPLPSYMCTAAALVLVLTSIPHAAVAQNAAVQIQVSNADASQQLALSPPTGLQGVQPNLAPWLVITGADAVGRVPLEELNMAAAAATAAGDKETVATVPAAPGARIQVANADAIGRFDLAAPAAASTSAAGGGDETGASDSGAPIRAARIQITGADAVGSLTLSAPDAVPAADGSPVSATPQPTAASEPTAAPTAAPAAKSTGTVIADGTLNLRSGPSRDFDVLGQLENGAQVTILSQSDDAQWLLVMTETGLTGWVAVQFIGQ